MYFQQAPIVEPLSHVSYFLLVGASRSKERVESGQQMIGSVISSKQIRCIFQKTEIAICQKSSIARRYGLGISKEAICWQTGSLTRQKIISTIYRGPARQNISYQHTKVTCRMRIKFLKFRFIERAAMQQGKVVSIR